MQANGWRHPASTEGTRSGCPGSVNQIHCNFWKLFSSHLESVFEGLLRNDSNPNPQEMGAEGRQKCEAQVRSGLSTKDRYTCRSKGDCGLHLRKKPVEI